MSYYEQSIHHLEELPSGAWRVVLEPRHVDPDRVFGAQLLIDTFTPDTNSPGEQSENSCYLDGVIGDPEDGTRATLQIDMVAQRRNARRIAAQAISEGVPHETVGTLYVTDNTESET